MEAPATSLLKAALGMYLIGGFAGLCCIRRERLANVLAFGSAILAGAFGLVTSVLVLGSGLGPQKVQFDLLPSLVPYVRFSVRLDPLAAFFLLIVSTLGLALSIYSLSYVRGFYGRKNVGVLGAFFNVLLLATTLVFLADNAFFFLIAWEIVALSAYCLVSFEHEQDETRKAGVLYFIMSHIGTGCLILGFLLLFQATGDYTGNGYRFEGFHALGDKMSPGSRNAAFLLFLIGFGVKAGIVP